MKTADLTGTLTGTIATSRGCHLPIGATPGNVMWKARFLEAPTIVVFALSMMVVVMVFGIYIGLFGVFARI
jgi:hypothetical protein